MSNGAALPPRRPAKRNTVKQADAARDPAFAKALQLSTFEDGYSTEDFITTLSDKLILQSKADPNPFNPTPFIQTFSPALDELLKLRTQVAERTKKMESDVRRAHREYGKRLRELDGGFEAVGSSFSALESKITDVGRTAARIGEQLESLHHTRSTAQTTSLLLSYYLALVQSTSVTVSSGDEQPPSPLESLYSTRTSRDGRARLAVILRRLMTLAKDVSDSASATLSEAEEAEKAAQPKGQDVTHNAHRATLAARDQRERAERVRLEVEKYAEKFEKEVLKLFDRAYRKGEPRMMAHCAKVLQDFNGGTSCVQIYVNQHDFFISKDSVIEKAGQDKGVDIWKRIGDPDAPSPSAEAGLDALFSEIRETVSQEAQIVKAVFPNPSAVMVVFLQRVFAQVIQQHIESLVSRASSMTTLAVLRILYLSHSKCSALVEDLKAYDASLSGNMSGPRMTDGSGPISTLLDQSLEEMFVPWLEGSRYLDSESKNLVELYAGLLSRFTRYHETVLKAKPNSLLDRVVNQMSTPGTSTPAGFSAATTAISKYANLFTSSTTSAWGMGSKPSSGTTSPPPQPPSRSTARLSIQPSSTPPPSLTPSGTVNLSRSNSFRGEDRSEGVFAVAADGLITLEAAERMLRWHAEAVGRVVELSPSSDVGKNAFALCKVLAEAIGRSFIDTALDSTLAKLDQHEARTEPDLGVLAVIKPADLVCHLWQRYASTALVPLAPANSNVRREMTTFNQHNIVRLEGRLSGVLHKAIDVIITWLAILLQKQKKNDYRPKNDELSFARTNTEPCEAICDFLQNIQRSVTLGLSGKNREAVLTEIGVAFHALLLDHYKRFNVNPTGGLMLTKDLASYQDAIAAFVIPALNDRMDMLRQLGNLFIVQPDVLRGYVTENHLGRIDSKNLLPYLQMRSDWYTFGRNLALDEGWDDTPSASGAVTPSVGGMSMSAMGASMGAMGASVGASVGGLMRGKSAKRLSSGAASLAGTGMQRLREALRDFEGITGDGAHVGGARPPPSAFRGGLASGTATPQLLGPVTGGQSRHVSDSNSAPGAPPNLPGSQENRRPAITPLGYMVPPH